MAYTTTTTSITSATSSRSKQATVYQYPSGNGVVITGASVNSNTTAYLGVTTPGAAQTYTAVSGGATITQIVYLDADNVPSNANAVSTTGGNIKIVGTGFASGAQVYINNTLVTNTVPNSTAIIATLTSGSVGNVSCYIFNSANSGGAISANTVRFSGAPSWVTAAAVSSVNGIASNIALQASGDGTLTYVLKEGSGTLPNGISLLSSGYLTGTATGYSADTVVTFTLIVRDSENQATQQTFNYTVFIGDTYFKQTSLLLSATVSNTFISDSSTNNFLITRFGDTRPSRLSPYWPGGWSAYFDGTGDYLNTVSSTAFNFGSGNFTVEAWINPTNVSGTKAIVAIFESVIGGWYLGLNGSSLRFSSGFADYDAGTIVAGVWSHVAATRFGNDLRIFINGNQVNTTTNVSAQNFNITNALWIGNMNIAGWTFTGYISNVRVVKGTALYTANFTPSTTSLTTVANLSILTLRDSILIDDSPYNFTLTRNGDTRLTAFSPFNTTPHTITANSNSVYFDGTGDYLTVAANAAFNMGAASNNFTMECWVYQTANSGTRGLFGPRPSTNSGFDAGYGFYIQDGVPTFQVWTLGSFAADTATGPTIPLNTWTHIAGVRNSSQIRVYVNGLGGTAVSTTRNGDNSSPFYIGSYEGANYLFTGYISNVRVLKGIAQYTANFTPATSSLTAISGTSLLACQANTIIDSNTTPKTITVNGNPNVSLSNPFGETVTTINNYTWSPTSYGASAYFDGATATRLSFASNNAFAFSTGAYTIEAWVYLTAYGSPSTNLIDCGGATNSLGLSIDSTGALGPNKYGSGYIFNTTEKVPLNAWSHVAVARSTTGINDTRVFINGKLSAIGTDNNNWTVTTSPTIGGINLAGYTVTGYLSDVRIIKGTALYTGPFIPPTAPLSNVANVSVLTLQSDIGSNSAQFVDQSPNNHLITRNGNASQGTFGPLVPSTWSAYFDGTGDYLTTPSNSAFTLGLDNFTIEAWIYPLAYGFTAAGGQIFGTVNGSTSGYSINLGQDINSFRIISNASGSWADTLTVSTGNGPALNTWTHIAIVRNGANLTIYKNGVSVATTASAASWNFSGTTAVIGRFNDGTNTRDYTGYISNVRILKGTAQYTANFTPATTTISPVANTSLLTLRGPAFTDDSGNNFTITRFGDTKIVPFGPFSPQIVTPDSYSYRFSNASDYISTTSSNLAFGSNNWTIEGWVYPRFTANSGVFQVSNVQYGLTNSNLNTVALGFSATNKAIVRVANATYTSTGTSITANTWTHLALVKNSNISKLYINGTLDSTIGTSGSITDTVSYTGTTNVAVGGYGSTSALANAYISNFRVVSNSAVYTENFTPAVGPLAAISGTALLTCQANTILDASGGNLTITANANVTPANFNPFDETITVGQNYSALADGGSAYFDGSGDYLQFPAGSATTIFGGSLTSSRTFTIDCWVYHTAYVASTIPVVIGDMQPTGSNNYWSFGTNSSGQLVLFWYDGAEKRAIGNTVIPLFSWAHIAVSIQSGAIKLFVNGIQQTITGTSTLTNATGSNGFIAIGQWVNTNVFTGYISNLRVLNGTALYNSAFVPPAAPALPTVANTSLLLNFTSSGVIDSTGRNVLETVADAKVTTNLKKYGTGSYYLDGSGDYMYVMGNSTEFVFGTGDFTIEFWIYFNSITSAILYDQRPASTQGLYPVVYVSSNKLVYYTNSADRIVGTTTINAATWYHVAVARANGVTKLFLNGVQEGSNYTDTNSYINAASRPIIGDQGTSIGASPVNGYYTDIRVTKGYARYTANFTVPSEPFITK